MSTLFSEMKLNSSKILTNALAVAPMTTSQSNPDGTVSEAEATWLERLAADDYGMIITCATAISKQSIGFYNQLSVGDDDKLPGLIQLAQRLKPYKAKTIIQLCHAGSRAIPELTGSPAYSASSYSLPQIPGFIPPLTLSIAQIAAIVEDFAAACERVAKAGFDGIEFHGANGFLFTQFISTMTNLRDDEYGGNLINRARFSREVVQACRRRVPSDFILGFRMTFESMGVETGLDMDENIQIINWLTEDGIDYLHISHLQYDALSLKHPNKVALQYIREHVNMHLPIVCAGGITTVENANAALEYGADIVAIGRAAIGNVNLPASFANNEKLPFSTPFSQENLRKTGISEDFMNYFKLPFVAASLKIINTEKP
jgi:2,4-dienoyl-CoA reductase-like NADH-dependent reductase (Old Yellow Enzyme family)